MKHGLSHIILLLRPTEPKSYPTKKGVLESKAITDTRNLRYSSGQGSLNRDDSGLDVEQITFLSQIYLRRQLILKGKEANIYVVCMFVNIYQVC